MKPLEFKASPTSTNINFLTQKINAETPEFGETHSFAFFMRDETTESLQAATEE